MWLLLLLVSFSTLLFGSANAPGDCSSLSSKYFQWLNTDGSLLVPTFEGVAVKQDYNDSCCGNHCGKPWKILENSTSCQFCASSNALVCQGSGALELPTPSTLPFTTLTLYKISGFHSVLLSPEGFADLNIHRLVVLNSTVTLMSDTFTTVKSIKIIDFKNNTLRYLSQPRFVFVNIPNLIALNLENNDLTDFYFTPKPSTGLQKLSYLGLTGTVIENLDLTFMHNSILQFLDFRSIKYKLKHSKITDLGLSSLPRTLNAVDFSHSSISLKTIQQIIQSLEGINITTINLSFLKSSTQLLQALRPLRRTLRRLSLEGTDLNKLFSSKSTEISNTVSFINLSELYMRNCKIEELGKGEVFKAFPHLTILSLADNLFYTIELSVFINLPSLSYLDLRSTDIQGIGLENTTSTDIQVLDLSFVDFDFVNYNVPYQLFGTMPHLQKLSLCSAKIDENVIGALQILDDLTFLDVSNTVPDSSDLIYTYNEYFSKTKASLKELYFAKNNFKFSDQYSLIFSGLISLKMLDLSNNIIRELSDHVLAPALEKLALSQNLITTWYSSAIGPGSKLKSVDLSDNQITYISDAMLQDFYKLHSLDLNNNPLICHRKVVAMVCGSYRNKTENVTMVNWQQYQCYDLVTNNYRLFSKPEACDEYYEEVSTTVHQRQQSSTNTPATKTQNSLSSSKSSWNELAIIGLPILTTVVGIIVYIKWWAIKCYVHRYFSLRRARLLRKENDSLPKSPIQYDVFVSYSDGDRAWVIDHLIPSMEANGDVSLCCHERDFQIGLNILENIIECMDRSHSLLLVISQSFVRSKWCQFEMHLALYRLIDTGRDQLVLVFLEDIPRNTRPKVLHHLMMTKTYLVWPQQPAKRDATQVFWRRLKRALKPSNILHY